MAVIQREHPVKQESFWIFHFPKKRLSVRHYRQHSCSPVKLKREQEIAEAVKKHSAIGVSAQKDIPCSML